MRTTHWDALLCVRLIVSALSCTLDPYNETLQLPSHLQKQPFNYCDVYFPLSMCALVLVLALVLLQRYLQ